MLIRSFTYRFIWFSFMFISNIMLKKLKKKLILTIYLCERECVVQVVQKNKIKIKKNIRKLC